jgi:hypothetical protein
MTTLKHGVFRNNQNAAKTKGSGGLYPNMTFEEDFSHALRDIPSNFREYFEFYESHWTRFAPTRRSFVSALTGYPVRRARCMRTVSQASAVLRPALEIYYELTEFAAAAWRCPNSSKSNRVSTALGRAPTYEGDERTDQEHNSGSDRETCDPRPDLLCLLLDRFPFLRRHVHRSHVFQHFLRPRVFLVLGLLPVLSQNTPIQLSISNTRFRKRWTTLQTLTISITNAQ